MNLKIRSYFVICIVVSIFVLNSKAQVDSNTLLYLKFENSLVGEQGETPISATGHSFQSGVQGQGVLLPNPNELVYPSLNNINRLEGTIEFWIKPNWNGNDGQTRMLFQWGNGEGVHISKDGGNNLKIIVNRFTGNAGGETAFNTSTWLANEFHHVAFTFSATQRQVKVYIDGQLKNTNNFVGALPGTAATAMQLGGLQQSQYANALFDNFVISDIARTEQDIGNRYFSSLTVTSLSANPNSMQMLPTWWKTPGLQAVTNLGTFNVPPSSAAWSSSNSAVATFDTIRGKIIANSAGMAILTATVNGAIATINVNVDNPVLPPLVEQISPHLANPMPNALWEMPVVIIDFLPTVDGVNVDPIETGWTQSLVGLRGRLDRMQIQHKYMLEEGSRFRAFGNTSSQPSLGYRVVYKITFFEKMPEGILDPGGQGSYFPDYDQILNRVNAQHFVNNLGVKEFWIGMYHHGRISPVESNMSSPTTGDISNSYRHNDLSIFNKTYLVYGLNFGRSASEATHNHGHQLEAILGYSNQRQTGNTQLFWQSFVGRSANGTWQRGRAGDTHHPPNALTDYDYSNTTTFNSDISTWTPSGGTFMPTSLPTWRNILYPFPDGVLPTQDDAWWYLYWFQSMPGRGNTIPFNTNRMTNWWQFTGDWDAANRAGVGLYEANNCNYSLSMSSQIVPSIGGTFNVNVTTNSGCKWFASENTNWTQFIGTDIGNGNGTISFSVLPNQTGVTRTTRMVIAGQPVDITQSITRSAPIDFDGDGKTDISVFRPTVGEWYYIRSGNSVVNGAAFGNSTDKPVPADYTGDGKTDIAFFRPSSGEWYILRSEDFSFFAFPFGLATDIPSPGDFDGDGKTDAAVFRPSNGVWYIQKSTGGVTIQPFGTNGDRTVVADYDGDGKSDIAIFRPSLGEWYYLRSSESQVRGAQFGAGSDKTVQGDYTGDGKADFAFFRPSTGNWFVLRSEDFSFFASPFGISTDTPTIGDYDGDGKFDQAVFRPSTGIWYVNKSNGSGVTIQPFGASMDLPVPSYYLP
jgi:Concanavalin A-like lectin/glucanases superfamily/FG-GAP-like repeat